MTTCRVLLVDDHALVRAGIRALLESLPRVEVVGETGDGLDALRLVRELAPDTVLLDITLAGLNGLEVATRITRSFPDTQVLMLSMHASPEYAARAFAAGARGYLNKDSAFDELAMAIEAIGSGRRYLCRALDPGQVALFERQEAGGASAIERLTPRQRQILQLVAEGSSTREIAEKLFLSVKTIETHRAQIMRRLDIHDVAGLVRFAIRHGLLPPEGS